MPIKKGTADLGDLFKGATPVDRVFKGNDLVWQRGTVLYEEFPPHSTNGWIYAENGATIDASPNTRLRVTTGGSLPGQVSVRGKQIYSGGALETGNHEFRITGLESFSTSTIYVRLATTLGSTSNQLFGQTYSDGAQWEQDQTIPFVMPEGVTALYLYVGVLFASNAWCEFTNLQLVKP